MKYSLVCLSIIIVVCLSKRFFFTRHGQRSPTEYNDFISSRWLPYKPGDLTHKGAQYLEEKGKYVSMPFKIYNDDRNCDSSKIEIISSVKERTILSTLGFLKGICPQNFVEISRQYIENYLKQYATNLEDYKMLIENDLSDIISLSDSTRHFKKPKDHLFHGQSCTVCPVLKQEKEKIIQSFIYRRTENHFKSHKEYQSILEYVKIQNKEDVKNTQYLQLAINPEDYTVEKFSMDKMKSFYSNVKCDIAQSLEVPPLTKQEQELLQQISEFILYFTEFSSDVQLKASLSETFKWILDSLDKPSINLHWYSAHDFNIVSVLAVLINPQELQQLKEIAIPPFGSDLHIEVDNDLVNIFYINTPLKTEICKKGYDCSIKEFKKYLNQFIVEDIESFCLI